jgi:L-glutamine-phosphate cytidylyltransferase
MKAIFIAAGEGSRMGNLTKMIPKPLIDVNGISILDRQICLLQKFGIDEIIVIRGPHPETYKLNVQYVDDVEFQKHDQLGSLMVAKKNIQNDTLIIFGDILFDESVLMKVLENKNDITIAVDMNWEKYESRYENPIEEADKVAISDGKIKRIFKDMKEIDENLEIGEFIGLMKLTKDGSNNFNYVYDKLDISKNGKFHDALSFKKAKLVDFLQEIIEHGIEIEPTIINGKWCEIDTHEDLELAKKLFCN